MGSGIDYQTQKDKKENCYKKGGKDGGHAKIDQTKKVGKKISQLASTSGFTKFPTFKYNSYNSEGLPKSGGHH